MRPVSRKSHGQRGPGTLRKRNRWVAAKMSKGLGGREQGGVTHAAFHKCLCVDLGSGVGWPWGKQCAGWALSHSSVGSGVREGSTGTQKSRVYNSLSRGREMGRELAKQRAWENVPGRGQQGRQRPGARGQQDISVHGLE